MIKPGAIFINSPAIGNKKVYFEYIKTISFNSFSCYVGRVLYSEDKIYHIGMVINFFNPKLSRQLNSLEIKELYKRMIFT